LTLFLDPPFSSIRALRRLKQVLATMPELFEP
jgi:hypothetical protein